MEKKKLIMGVTKNYWWYKIEPFYVSCSKYNGKNCDIVAFTKNLSDFTRDKLREYHIHCVEIPDSYEKNGPIDYRYGLYIEMLKKKGENYDQVLFCDTRDVFFQDAMFPEDADKPYLGVAVESGLINGDDWNRRWMQERFGEEIYNELKDNHVLCAGTIWGSTSVIRHFCQAMIDNLSDPQFNFIDINDQTSYQYMVYKGIEPVNAATCFSSLEGGRVATIGNEGDFSVKGDSLFCPEGGSSRPALVHQWDRHKKLNSFVKRLYRERHPRIRWKRYKDWKSLKDIALTAYHDGQVMNMLIASVKYLFAEKPRGERLWK